MHTVLLAMFPCMGCGFRIVTACCKYSSSVELLTTMPGCTMDQHVRSYPWTCSASKRRMGACPVRGRKISPYLYTKHKMGAMLKVPQNVALCPPTKGTRTYSNQTSAESLSAGIHAQKNAKKVPKASNAGDAIIVFTWFPRLHVYCRNRLLLHVLIVYMRPRWLGRWSACRSRSISRVQIPPSACS